MNILHISEIRGILPTDVLKSLAERVKSKLDFRRVDFYVDPFLTRITTLASLAHHGILGSMRCLWMIDLDLASVPNEHLVSLVSCLTEYLYIKNVSNCNIISILDSVKSEKLHIDNQSLSSEETRALVRAMESGVMEVKLGFSEEVSLDMTALTQYNGQGKCVRVQLGNVITFLDKYN